MNFCNEGRLMLFQETNYFGNAGHKIFFKFSMPGPPYHDKESDTGSVQLSGDCCHGTAILVVNGRFKLCFPDRPTEHESGPHELPNDCAPMSSL